MKTILVTGGAGFIGSHLVERLLEHDFYVVCLDDLNDYYDPNIKRANIAPFLAKPSFEFVKGDIRDTVLLTELFQRYKFWIVVHLAARAGVRPSLQDPHLYLDVNVRGTLNLLQCSVDSDIPKFIYGSSSSVYGLNQKVPFSETDNVSSPISPYAVSKASAELLCHTYHHLHHLPIIILRFFTVYGPRQRPDLAIHKFTRLIDQGKEVPMFGDGSSKRDYTYIDDVIDGVAKAMNYETQFDIFNLGNSHPVELRYLIHLIEENLGKRAIIAELPEQAGDVPITFADISKSQRLLGYNPRTPIEEGIRSFIRWYYDYK
ncbi:MAG: GDP-mannose 4,6-dehydratase [Chloroflexi bacterium]|nr:GDP-mannose 4,6-dehydratase [Chloroflexota bacterium]MCL5076408.1 GDP-mannose 4,6-dehydratase [Chloroflexota bacterium]